MCFWFECILLLWRLWMFVTRISTLLLLAILLYDGVKISIVLYITDSFIITVVGVRFFNVHIFGYFVFFMVAIGTSKPL